MPTTTKNAALWVYDGTKWVRVNPDAMGAAPADHTHTVTGIATGTIGGSVNGGGDTETAPKHYSVNYFIKGN